MIVVSYRGPVTSAGDGDTTVIRRATGGLVNTLAPALASRDTSWLFTTGHPGWSAEVRRRADEMFGGSGRLHPVAVDPETAHLHYDLFANSLLWPLFHNGFDRSHAPSYDRLFHRAWRGYQEVNRLVAAEVAVLARPGEAVVVHDYQLMLVPGMLKRQRPDLALAYFHHIPFVYPDSLGTLARPVAGQVLSSLNAVPAGFQSTRWQRAFEQCCRDYLETRDSFSFVAPVGPDIHHLDTRAGTADVARHRSALRRVSGGRRLVGRVDRADPMKNVERGLRAADLLLTESSDLARNTVFVHHLVPTRESVPGYREHADTLDRLARDINARHTVDGRPPVIVYREDDYDRAIALLAEYDVLLVNPVREGMNLVAQEGPLLNTRSGVVVVSEECGSSELLADAALGVHPLDVAQTAEALRYAIEMGPDERAERGRRLEAAVRHHCATPWHDSVVDLARLLRTGAA
ncbi:alpha,alpha-trehalose-phosphate synthase (UDP-forming) [Micromonospora sp. CPCC 206061]|uniref:alpha,alpha-trehalose-phosphate synthase (UDP-forming) n=1 Tax=Micromonospora sp. CPCC 206061 TaxID=3122410 RepID=UPI002FF22836